MNHYPIIIDDILNKCFIAALDRPNQNSKQILRVQLVKVNIDDRWRIKSLIANLASFLYRRCIKNSNKKIFIATMIRRLLFSIILFCLARLMAGVNAQNLNLTGQIVDKKIYNQYPAFM